MLDDYWVVIRLLDWDQELRWWKGSLVLIFLELVPPILVILPSLNTCVLKLLFGLVHSDSELLFSLLECL